MIIAYEPETKKAIEKVIDVFKDYILTSIHFDLLWSDKLGYIYIGIDNVRGSIGDTGWLISPDSKWLISLGPNNEKRDEISSRLTVLFGAK